MHISEDFKDYLINEKKLSKTGAEIYARYVYQYCKFHKGVYGDNISKLNRESVELYLKYIKSRKLEGKIKHQETINKKISALQLFNIFLMEKGVQEELIINKYHFINSRLKGTDLIKITYDDIERFREVVLIKSGVREYAIITILAYASLKLEQCLNLKFPNDIDFEIEKIIMSSNKPRGQIKHINMDYRIKTALIRYLMSRESNSEFLFTAEDEECLEQIINNLFKKYAPEINPDLTISQLRLYSMARYVSTNTINSVACCKDELINKGMLGKC